jgi:hypothetical protein
VTALPREVIALALDGAVLAAPSAPGASAHRLTEVAFGQGGPTWKPLRRLLSTRDIWLRNTWVRYDGGQPLAVGKLQCLDRAAGVYWVALDGAALRDGERVLLFGDRQRAMRAATLAAASRCAQRLCGVIAALLCKDDVEEDELPPLDAAMGRLRGALHLAQEDWPARSIQIPITLEENLTPKGLEIVAELVNVALNTPAAAPTIQ